LGQAIWFIVVRTLLQRSTAAPALAGGTEQCERAAGTGVSLGMSDPRNVAHDKKVKQGKEHKPEAETTAPPNEKGKSAPPAPAAADQSSEDLEKSIALLSKLKEMEFHSRANIETLAELTLTIDDELKQKEFSDPIGRLYSTQDQFHTQIAALIESYEAHLESLKPSA
jgi:hypothetical protein